MSRRCLTCAHPGLEKINEAIRAGTKLSELAKMCGISADSLERHVRNQHVDRPPAPPPPLDVPKRKAACPVCDNPNVRELERLWIHRLATQQSLAEAAGCGRAAIRVHMTDHLPKAIAEAVKINIGNPLIAEPPPNRDHIELAATVQEAQQRKVEDGAGILAQLQELNDRMWRLFRACEAAAVDPYDAASYWVGPRAADVQVAYVTWGEEDKPLLQRASLQELITRALHPNEANVQRLQYTGVDSRRMMLDTAAALRATLTTIGAVVGEIQQSPMVAISLSPEWGRIKQALLTALAPEEFEPARLAVIRAFRSLREGG